MNLAHLHLILNHVPVVGVPGALLFLAIGIYQNNRLMQKTALFVLVGLAVLVLPVYFTGEPAEEVIEHLPGFAETFIEPHEEAAIVSLILTLITGVAAVAALWIAKDAKKGSALRKVTLAFGCAAVASLFYTANLGGQVRHTELRSNATTEAPVVAPAEMPAKVPPEEAKP
jgi:uncharacterized membrane protein